MYILSVHLEWRVYIYLTGEIGIILLGRGVGFADIKLLRKRGCYELHGSAGS